MAEGDFDSIKGLTKAEIAARKRKRRKIKAGKQTWGKRAKPKS
mgnify:CR=1 FL=1